ncbi:maltose operon protein MalM [Enterobacter hormaechei]|jgi:maltose operon protein|uniref:maltose operon protein MalM n=1 Tax=Enterobacter cloacae complex TaxID=354276 RepID=UPI0005DA67B2|nr:MULTISPECIES: maltose operon protein MalM [Enterobacter cloacae complex]EKK5518609.1 maltose operon protein MalM [Enterobacter hormaechei]EKV8161313.1 maltose operon protein MalM [Enterobacter hormaechei subsp. xiangfangensis]KJX26689.1 maltose-binding protein [Enterobacter hormaechei subsp. xiangfangensis]KUQ97307.1 maltose operon protein MalM [Enterobacter hormaechei subsp. xiangfangensis]KZP65468.1 maltose operon protein MalM [Enterobacter hormaechei subsp. xiangfangensis]
MKMKKNLVALCLSAGLLACVPGVTLADVNYVPQNTSAAPAIPTAALQQLTWTPVDQSKTQSTQLATGGQQLNVAGITGPVAAYSVPANIGELTLTLSSEVNKQTSVFAPNVLILDQNMTPSAYFPSSYFTYQEPGVMSADRLEGVMRLTPALGQQKLYVLVFTTEKDLQQTTTLLDPAKAYAKGVGNAIPDIPDPIARHTTDGLLKLKVKTNSSSSVLVGPLFGSSGPGPVTVGNTAAPVYAAPAATPAAAPAPAKKAEPVLNDTETYFNNAIKQAVKNGDVDKALKLLDEAERLGSTTARSTFISSVKGKG